MALRDLQGLLPRLVAELSGVSRPLALLHLQDAARLLCEQSEAWCEWLPEAVAAAGQTAFTLEVPTGYDAAVKRVLEVQVDGVALDPSSWSFVGGVLTLLYGLRAVQKLKARVVFQPEAGCAQFPEALVRDHGLGIAAGAMGTLKLMDGKTWSDPQGARKHLLDFGRAVGEAGKNKDLAGKADIRIPIPRF